MFSLAATNIITFVFFSSGYLDVSVLQVTFNFYETEYKLFSKFTHSEIRKLIYYPQLIVVKRPS